MRTTATRSPPFSRRCLLWLALLFIPTAAAVAFNPPPTHVVASAALAAARGGGSGVGMNSASTSGASSGEKETNKGTVCVTGANGYVAAELVKQLLARGYHVRGTVRSLAPERRARYAFLEQMATGEGEKGGRLELLEADLQAPGSFDAAVEGCAAVFHVASPVVYDTPDPERDLIAPALAGVENVLGAVDRATNENGGGRGGMRVVLTSSTGAVCGANPKDAALGLFTEKDWNDAATIETLPYYYSKVVAERRAWALAKEKGIDLVVVNPAYVWGPPAAAGAGSFNTARLRAVLKGEQPPWAFGFPVCDARDIAAVQIAAAETPTASGRYIISSSSSVAPSWIADVLNRRFPGRFPNMGQVNRAIRSKALFDTRKTEALLGRPLRDPEETLCDMVQALLDEEEGEL